MKASPLQLEDYFLKRLEFSLTEDLRQLPDQATTYKRPNINVEVDVTQRPESPRHWRCELTVSLSNQTDQRIPYRFLITYVGFFRVVDEYPAELVERMTKTNAPALLYSAAREALVSLTGRSHYPTLVLPSVTFIQPIEEKASPPTRSTRKAASTKRPPQKPVSRQGQQKAAAKSSKKQKPRTT